MNWSRGETRGDWIFVHTASLDEPENFAPSSHLGIGRQALQTTDNREAHHE
jgi:hypothetical protein